MPTVAIVDDEPRYRNSDVRALRLKLPKGWKAIGISPLPTLGEYPSWIADNEVAALLVDQNLGAKSNTGKGHVDYQGHDLVRSLRKRNKTLPIYFLTGFTLDTEVKEQATEVDGTFDKKDFRRDRAGHARRITRRGKEYFNSFKDQLAQLNELSVKIATGKATPKERRDARAIQTNLEIPLLTETFSDRSEWLAQFEVQVEQFERLQTEIHQHLKKNQNRKRSPGKKK